MGAPEIYCDQFLIMINPRFVTLVIADQYLSMHLGVLNDWVRTLMPHAELKYSIDLDLDAVALLRCVEQIILRHDANSGECKGRAYPADEYHHSHCLLNVSMLSKSHRDKAFTNALLLDLEAELCRHLRKQCFLSLGIQYSDNNYITTAYVPENLLE
jgi:hypothetical protein